MTPGTAEPTSYADLLAAWQPRLITNEEDAARVQDAIDSILDKGPETPDEIQLLRLLGGLVRLWEGEHREYRLADIAGADAVRVMLEERGLKQADLVGPVFPTASVASEVMNDKRRMSLETITKLSRFFRVPPSVFIEELALPSEEYATERHFHESSSTWDKKPGDHRDAAWRRVQAATSELVAALQALERERADKV